MTSRSAVLVGLLLLGGCAAEATAGDYVDATRRQSEEADGAVARGDHAAAVEALEALVEMQVPTQLGEDHARVIRQDAHDRLARSLLALGEPTSALVQVERGLALGAREDLFTANLVTTRGRILEAQGRDRDAAREYHRALTIHEALLDEALGDRR